MYAVCMLYVCCMYDGLIQTVFDGVNNQCRRLKNAAEQSFPDEYRCK